MLVLALHPLSSAGSLNGIDHAVLIVHSSAMTASIVEHWRRLTGAVHPDDVPVFDGYSHSFNLDYPPPAFIGDVENAPVVLLDANGGYNPDETPQEFAVPSAVERYIDQLHNPRRLRPSELAPYYARRNFASLIGDGRLALVNAVAYRSAGISKEPQNRRVAALLPSTDVHRRWLRTELLKQAASGERLVIAHRNSLWNLKKSEHSIEGVIFTTNPVSPDLSFAILDLIRLWKK